MNLTLRYAVKSDLENLLRLYTQLHDNHFPKIDGRIEDIWCKITDDKNYYIVLGCEGERAVSSCVINIIPNLTHSQRPYAVIENVVTDVSRRHRGYATAVLDFAGKKAVANGCYKIMLMTGSKDESTLNFYRKAGYNSEDKTAFIRWL